MALNMHEGDINVLREPRNNEGEPVKLLFRERMVNEKWGIKIDHLPKKLLRRRNTAIHATIAEAVFCIVSIPMGAVGRGLSRASLYINVVTLGMALIGLWACINLKGPWVTAHYLTTFSLTGLFVLYCLVAAVAMGSDNVLLLLVLVAFMLSDVIAGIFTYLFMLEYNQFKKDIIAGKYDDVRRVATTNSNDGNDGGGDNNPDDSPPDATPQLPGHFSDVNRLGGNHGNSTVAPIINNNVDTVLRTNTYSDCPELYKCPITTEIMKDPVTAEDGYTYERSAISEWFKDNDTSPMTNMKIGKNIVPNRALKSATMEFMDKVDRDNA
eukprot:g9226.t1